MRSVLFLLWGFFLSAEAADIHSRPAWVSSTCQGYLDYLAEAKANDSQFFKRFFEVDESAEPESAKLPLFVYGKLVKKEGKILNPILFVNGGPGASSHYSDEAFAEIYAHPEVSIIFFDQRGTGCSEPKRLNQANSQFIENMSDSSALAGINLQYYGSRSVVGDMEFLRKELLQGERWQVVLGQSHGADIALRYMSLHPESTENFIVHGASHYNSITELDIATVPNLRRLNQEFFQTYPVAREQMNDLHRLVTKDDCFYNVCGQDLWDYLFGSYLGFRMYFADLKDLIEKIHQGRENIGEVVESLKWELGEYYFAHYVVATAVSNMEYRMALTREQFTRRESQMQEALGFSLFSEESYSEFPIMPFRFRFSENTFPEVPLDPLDISLIRPSEKTSLTVYSSEDDIYTPDSTSRVFSTIPGVQWISIAGDHDSFTSSEVQQEVIKKAIQ